MRDNGEEDDSDSDDDPCQNIISVPTLYSRYTAASLPFIGQHLRNLSLLVDNLIIMATIVGSAPMLLKKASEDMKQSTTGKSSKRLVLDPSK